MVDSGQLVDLPLLKADPILQEIVEAHPGRRYERQQQIGAAPCKERLGIVKDSRA